MLTLGWTASAPTPDLLTLLIALDLRISAGARPQRTFRRFPLSYSNFCEKRIGRWPHVGGEGQVRRWLQRRKSLLYKLRLWASYSFRSYTRAIRHLVDIGAFAEKE